MFFVILNTVKNLKVSILKSFIVVWLTKMGCIWIRPINFTIFIVIK